MRGRRRRAPSLRSVRGIARGTMRARRRRARIFMGIRGIAGSAVGGRRIAGGAGRGRRRRARSPRSTRGLTGGAMQGRWRRARIFMSARGIAERTLRDRGIAGGAGRGRRRRARGRMSTRGLAGGDAPAASCASEDLNHSSALKGGRKAQNHDLTADSGGRLPRARGHNLWQGKVRTRLQFHGHAVRAGRAASATPGREPGCIGGAAGVAWGRRRRVQSAFVGVQLLPTVRDRSVLATSALRLFRKSRPFEMPDGFDCRPPRADRCRRRTLNLRGLRRSLGP
eukprot:2035543-Alexandrium_andersonii.AAC.2